jgi:hypothetical protein
MNMVSRINHDMFKKVNVVFVDLFAQISKKDVNSPDIIQTRKLCDEIVSAMGDFFAFSFFVDPNTRPPFDVKYVIAVKDANMYNTVIDEFGKIWPTSAFNDFYKSMGIDCNYTVNRGIETYKGVSIDSAKLSMEFTDANMPDAEMFNAIYGKGFNYHWAIVNGILVGDMSSDVNTIYKLIDQAKTGTPPPICSEMQKAMTLIPDADKDDIIATYNVLRLMKYIQVFAPMPIAMPDVATKSNIVIAAKTRNGSFTIDIAAPKEHIAEISTAFQTMNQQMMQKQMQMQQAPIK